MKRIISGLSLSSLTLAATLAGAAAASAATTTVPVQAPSTLGTRLALVDEQSGKTIAEFVAVFDSRGPVPNAALGQPEFKRAIGDVVPLTVQQQNDAAERALESQGAPLHTP